MLKPVFLDEITPDITETVDPGSPVSAVIIAVLVLAVLVGAFFVWKTVRKKK